MVSTAPLSPFTLSNQSDLEKLTWRKVDLDLGHVKRSKLSSELIPR